LIAGTDTALLEGTETRASLGWANRQLASYAQLPGTLCHRNECAQERLVAAL